MYLEFFAMFFGVMFLCGAVGIGVGFVFSFFLKGKESEGDFK